MSLRVHLFLPLLSSFLFVAGALLIKRGTELGVGIWRTAFTVNILTGLFFGPLWFWGGPGQPLDLMWQPVVAALVLMAGQAFAWLALGRGDVSVATPVMGVKTVLVALFTTSLLAQALPVKLWAGAALSALAIGLLNRSKVHPHHQVGLTVVCAMIAAGLFALFDVLVMKWAPAWGAGRFLPIIHGIAALFSFGLIPLFRVPLSALSPRAWRSLLGGAGLLALQNLLFIATVGFFGDATAVNIVYSSRGLWSVLAVWLIGHWFENREQELGRSVLGWRLAGAGAMTAAIVLALV